MATELYERTIRWSRDNLDDEGHALTQKCWETRPWMINAYTGSIQTRRERDMMEWLRDTFGDEAWPIHGRPGDWYRGAATVHGWTHIGFATKEMMDLFAARWPAPEEAKP